MQLRNIAQEAAARTSHAELLAKSIAARSDPATHFGVADLEYFYRKDRLKLRPDVARGIATSGHVMGPGFVVAQHSAASVWIQCGGRMYLVAKEHIRALTPEEEAVHEHRPWREALAVLKNVDAEPRQPYANLTDQEVAPGDVARAAFVPEMIVEGK